MVLASFFSRLQSRLRSIEDRMQLRYQVAMATSLLCFVLVAAIANGVLFFGRGDAIRGSLYHLGDIAVTFVDRVDWNLENRVGFAEYLASLDALRDRRSGSPDDLRHMLDQAAAALMDTIWVGFAASDGSIVAGSGGLFEGLDASPYKWFAEGRNGTIVVDPRSAGAHDGTVVGATDFAIDRFVEIGVPVLAEDGSLTGVIGLFIGPNWLNRLRAATVADINANRGIELLVVNEHGTVIGGDGTETFSLAAYDLAGMLATPPGTAGDQSVGEYLSMVAVSNDREDRPRWIAIARQTVDTALAVAVHAVWVIVILGLVVGIAGVAGSILIASRVSAPFRELADKAALIGRDTTQTIPRVRGSHEALHLSTVLRSLVLRLSHAERSTAEAKGRAALVEQRLSDDIAKLRSLADLDPLTELLNRRAFMDFAVDAFEQYRRYRKPFAILMIDVDHFKRVNDSLGHAVGDTALRAIARTVARTLRPSDKGARFGGEEFVALLREVSRDEAGEVAERLRAAIAASPIAAGADGDLFVTVSVGVAACASADADAQAVIERADVALYEAKGRGRNAVVRADEPAETVRQIA
jgi:diguanylate cyclase (GGDEF)-like protein